MAVIIDERTKIPLLWAVAIISAIVGVVATSATAHYRLGALEQRMQLAEAKQETSRDQQHEVDKRLQRFEDKLDTMSNSVQRIERKMFSEER